MLKHDLSAGKHDHQRIEVHAWCPACGRDLGHQVFNRADLEPQQLTELPDREAMSVVGAHIGGPMVLSSAAATLELQM